MNYLTNYYKNLCEQLEQKILSLQETIRSATEIDNLGWKEYEKAIDAAERKSEDGRLTSQERDDIMRKTVTPYARRSARRESMIQTALGRLADVAASGDVETAQQVADVMARINKRDIGGKKQAGFADREEPYRERALENREKSRELSQELIDMGHSDTRPPDIAAMRKFIQMGRTGKGGYKAPYPQPE